MTSAAHTVLREVSCLFTGVIQVHEGHLGQLPERLRKEELDEGHWLSSPPLIDVKEDPREKSFQTLCQGEILHPRRLSKQRFSGPLLLPLPLLWGRRSKSAPTSYLPWMVIAEDLSLEKNTAATEPRGWWTKLKTTSHSSSTQPASSRSPFLAGNTVTLPLAAFPSQIPEITKLAVTDWTDLSTGAWTCLSLYLPRHRLWVMKRVHNFQRSHCCSGQCCL